MKEKKEHPNCGHLKIWKKLKKVLAINYFVNFALKFYT